MKQLYRSYNESTEIFLRYAKQYPNLIKLESIGQTWEKRDINLVTISNDIINSNSKPALFFTGTIHAREWVGHELAIEFVKYVVNNIDLDPNLQKSLESSTIYLVPCANPDGFEYSRNHFSFWRKNRRQNADGSYGVDLNRNFSIGFTKNSNPTSNIYGGPEPFSEPETKALKNFVDSHPNITIALDYHSQGNVFFPAHDFRHEDTIDTTDMNILCANMAEEIRKVSGREYGIHQGKPPAELINGSGREYYYSKGIVTTVVEVGTRNISDYLDDMIEHLREHVPALLEALKIVPNYSKNNELKRVNSFEVEKISSKSVTLKWDYQTNNDIYFEIYRSRKDKKYCNSSNLIAKTQALSYVDENLDSSTDYFYNIRVATKHSKVKSPYYPQLRVKTLTDDDEFSRIYYANAKKTGYVAQKIKDNAKHFGINSLFVGIDENKGISYAIVKIDLKTIPDNAIIKSANFSLYPINRVSTTIEKYGEWSVGIVDKKSIINITDYNNVKDLKIKNYIGRPVKAKQLTQGIWRNWEFSADECAIIGDEIKDGAIYFRIEGPKELRVGRKSQMMQWDIGYGTFGFGLPYRPSLELTFTVKPNIAILYPKAMNTVSKDNVKECELCAGFDKNGKKIYSTFEFNLSSLPPYDYTIITKAYLELNSTQVYIKDDIRFHLEFVDEAIDKNYKNISKREVIENIGYDVSANELKNNQKQYFVFDTFSQQELNKKLKNKDDVAFVLRPTSSKKIIKNKTVNWFTNHDKLAPKLIIEYIHKRRFPVEQVQNFKISSKKAKIKLTWNNPKNKDFAGVKVIKNPYRIPKSHIDGQKLYAGQDNYTYDDFGAMDKTKYYAIFTYDNVPNYSKPIVIKYEGE